MRVKYPWDAMFGNEGFYARRVRKSSRPYTLALLQFFEECRNRLASYTIVSDALWANQHFYARSLCILGPRPLDLRRLRSLTDPSGLVSVSLLGQ